MLPIRHPLPFLPWLGLAFGLALGLAPHLASPVAAQEPPPPAVDPAADAPTTASITDAAPTAPPEPAEPPIDPQRLRGHHWIIDRTDLWQRSDNLLWNFHNLSQFSVIHEPDDAAYPFKALFHGWPTHDQPTTGGAIFLARSPAIDAGWEVFAGVHPTSGTLIWDAQMDPTLWRPVMQPGAADYAALQLSDPSLVKVGGRYLCALTAVGPNTDGIASGLPGDIDGNLTCIAGAVSEDLVHWTLAPEPLLLNPADREPFEPGMLRNHYFGSYQRPALLARDDGFDLWFNYEQPNDIAMGHAINRGDFLNREDWRLVRAGADPCLSSFPNPDVVRIGGLLYAFADPLRYGIHPWRGRWLTEAVSADGRNWIVLGHIKPDPDATANQVPQALVLDDGDGVPRVCVFYSNQLSAPEGQPYDARMQRIRVLTRPITRLETEFYTRLLGQAAAGLAGGGGTRP